MTTEETAKSTLERWQSASAWPMIGLSVLYIIAYVVPIYYFPLTRPQLLACRSIEYGTWVIFVLDYIVQVALAKDRWKFFRKEWFALAVLLLPFFRPIRAIRGLIIIRTSMTRRRSLVRSMPIVLGAIGGLLVLIIGAAVLNVERFAPGATITNTSDALWWALSTLTTSSDGNLTPITDEGRILGAVLLIFGLGLLASMTGLVATWILDQVGVTENEIKSVTDHQPH